ncbi:MAG: dephospho-CoA kinase [Deltaproteobacteria bacterium]|nr:dephospho-CoA kinase [Deltaproteobacteria bacterium]
MTPRVIGLTGGIASGKSTVSAELRRLGAPVIDADEIARDVVAPGTPALAEIVAEFGAEYLAADGTLDRKRLGALVFAEPARRARLNAITHPRVGAETARRTQELGAAGHPVVIYDVPLLVESRLHEAMAGVIVVSVPREVQLRRLMARDGIDLAAAEARLAAQLPLEAKLKVADYVIDNAGSVEDTRRQTAVVWQDIVAGGPRRPRGQGGAS